jgi:hypothetical protein
LTSGKTIGWCRVRQSYYNLQQNEKSCALTHHT